MPKKTTKTPPIETLLSLPVFDDGLVVSSRSIYFDCNGRAWLVDPPSGTVRRIEIEA